MKFFKPILFVRKKQFLHIRYSSVILFLYFVLVMAFFFVMGDAMLNEETSIQFFADSVTYEQAAIDLKELSALQLLIYNPNYFGPISILNLLGGNRWSVLVLNLFVFTLSLSLICSAISLDRKLFIICLIINPMTFSSLLSINKEIFSLFAIALLIYGISRQNLPALLVCLGVSFLVRWQFSLFVIVLLGVISPLNPLRHRRFLTLLVFIMSISALYYVVRPMAFTNVSEVATAGAEQWEGTGLWGRLLEIQDSGGYFLVFPLKVLQAMFGILVYIDKIIDPPEFYNYVVVMLHSLTTLIVLAYSVVNKKLKLAGNITYMALIYLLIFGFTPIYAPRYFYPVFVMLCVLAAEKSIGQYVPRRLESVVNRNSLASY